MFAKEILKLYLKCRFLKISSWIEVISVGILFFESNHKNIVNLLYIQITLFGLCIIKLSLVFIFLANLPFVFGA